MRAAEFVTERKKKKRKNRYFGGYWYPGFGYYGGGYSGSGDGNGGGDGGGGESVSEAVIGPDDPVDVYIRGQHRGETVTRLVARAFPNKNIPLLIRKLETKYGVNPDAVVYGPSQIQNENFAEGLYEAVGGNYLYHATSADGLKGILSSDSIRSATGPQAATSAQTKLPTVSVTRDWGYASGSNAQNQMSGVGRHAVLVLNRNAIENHFKTLSTSQSELIKGLAFNPYLKKGGEARSQNTDQMARTNAKAKAKYAEPTAKAGGEFEEAVVVPKGALPLKGTMVGFWVNPDSELMKDPAIMNDPRRLDMVRPNQFVKANQTQGVAEGKQPGKSVVDAILRVMPVAQEIWFHGSRATGKHRRNSDTDILVVVPDNLVGDKYLSAVRILQKLNSHFDNYDIQPTKTGTNTHRIAQEEGRLLWPKQGVAENFADGKIKGKSRPGRVKRSGASCAGSVSELRARAKKYGGERGRMYHWCANMKSGRKK